MMLDFFIEPIVSWDLICLDICLTKVQKTIAIVKSFHGAMKIYALLVSLALLELGKFFHETLMKTQTIASQLLPRKLQKLKKIMCKSGTYHAMSQKFINVV